MHREVLIAAQTLRVDDEHLVLLRCRVDLAVLLIEMNEERGLKEAEDLLRQSVRAVWPHEVLGIESNELLDFPAGRAGQGC